MKRGRRKGGIRRTQKQKQKQKQKTVILPQELPQELINQILSRLPVKSLLRFKSVCKSWLSLISDPRFAISHFELAAARTDRLAILEPHARDFRSIDLNASLHDDSASDALNLNIMLPESFYPEIVGSCRGFLLLICARGIYVWNPSTGVHNFVDWSPIVSSTELEFEFTAFLYGFGYDPSIDDYLVVLGSYDHHRVTHFEYFSVRANAWKEIEATHLSYEYPTYNDNKTGCLFNGVIHWLAFPYDGSMNIVAFDLTERSILEMPLPVDFDYSNKFCLLRVLGELLSLCVVGRNRSVEIWVMEKYKVQSSWTKTVVMSAENITTHLYFFPICSTTSGDIVGKDFSTALVKCDDKGQLQEYRSYFDGRRGLKMAVYTESLLSLPCDSEQASCRKMTNNSKQQESVRCQTGPSLGIEVGDHVKSGCDLWSEHKLYITGGIHWMPCDN